MHTGLESSRLDATSGSRPSLHSDCGEGLQGAVFSITQGKKATIYFTQGKLSMFFGDVVATFSQEFGRSL